MRVLIIELNVTRECSEARPNEPAFKRYALYNGEKPGFSLANRKSNFCADYCGNEEQVYGLKTSCVAKAEMVV